MRLYDTQRSGNAWKVRLLAGLLGLRLDRTTLSIDAGDLRVPGFVDRNPLAQVPVLELDDGRRIAESMAILFWLARGTAFWPDDPFEQAEVLTWLSFEQAQHMRPLAHLRLHLALHRNRRGDEPDMVALRVDGLRVLGLLERRLQAQQASGWVVGRHPSIADVALYPYTCFAPMGGIALAAFPAITAWLARMEALPGYAPLFPGEPQHNLSTAETRDPR